MGKCPNCGKELILNNIYAEQYDEKGYLENWAEYHNWLQNTWNHKLVILEIGEGTRFPSIMKNPFERIAMFQQKQSSIELMRSKIPLPGCLPCVKLIML